MFKNLLPILLALSALPAGATTTFYVGAAGEAQFTADALTRGLTIGSMFDFGGELSGLTILDAGPTDVDFTGNSALNVDGTTITINGSSSVLQVALPSGVYAIGMYLTGTSSSNKTWTYGPSGSTMVLNNSTTTFFGAMSTVPLDALPVITLTGPASITGMTVSSFELGTVTASMSETPEPSTFALVGVGLIAFPWIARRRRTPRV